ncbi:membrane-associated protein, putative [Bodo saltans]|uniref:Membrane-associated protein, putative n=1 Tax=Bodo saltans TaxID=75058 RepID=A0A0S4JLG6_BODSA|nr:membrane-associated protein, putative [Bodo saltans]|eukprot:CUG91444.1 membrane-associated protein, putative [Bodo saltans]
MATSHHHVLVAVVAILATVAWTSFACETDDHCRPSSCCHSNQCVDTTKAPPPNCTDVLCTAGCEHDTLDCGGECMCTASKVCAPHVRAGMPPDGAGDWGVPKPQTGHARTIKRVVIRKQKG